MPPSNHRNKGERFAADKVVVASLAGAAFGAMLLAIAHDGGAPAIDESAVTGVTGAARASGEWVAATSPKVTSGTSIDTGAVTADPTPAPAAPAQVPRARRSRGS